MKQLIIGLLFSTLLSSVAMAAGSAQAGKEKAAACVACHGEADISAVPTFPNLAGQYEDYLYHALNSYKTGARNNAIMIGISAGLSKQDMEDLAAYFASLQGLNSYGLPE